MLVDCFVDKLVAGGVQHYRARNLTLAGVHKQFTEYKKIRDAAANGMAVVTAAAKMQKVRAEQKRTNIQATSERLNSGISGGGSIFPAFPATVGSRSAPTLPAVVDTRTARPVVGTRTAAVLPALAGTRTAAAALRVPAVVTTTSATSAATAATTAGKPAAWSIANYLLCSSK